METENTQNAFLVNLGHAALQCLFILAAFFTAPYKLWLKSINELADMKGKSFLNVQKIDSPWPFLSFLKRLCMEAIFTFCTFLSYPIGIISGLVAGIVVLFEGGAIEYFFGMQIGVYISAYFAPYVFALFKDILQLFLVKPVSKYLSWLKKPAQYMDFTINQK